MMFTILGVPEITSAANYDLVNSEYSFVVDELSKSSFSQVAIINQVDITNSASIRQEGTKLLLIILQEGSGNRAKTGQTGSDNSTYIDQTGSSNDASTKQSSRGSTAMITQKSFGSEASATQCGT